MGEEAERQYVPVNVARPPAIDAIGAEADARRAQESTMNEPHTTMPGTHAERALHPLESGLHAAADWINETQRALGEDDAPRAIRSLRAVLHAVRDELTVEEAADAAAQMPDLIRGIFYEGWQPANASPAKDRTARAFLDRVSRRLTDRDDPEHAASAAFATIRRKITRGEAEQIRNMLTGEVQEMWPQA